MSAATRRYDVVVIGAGQAGLAIGYHLARQGRRFAILEDADSVGAAWGSRWDSLVLFTPRMYDALPGLPFPGDPEGYPKRDEVAAYLERYAKTFELPIELESRVLSLNGQNGEFLVELEGETIESHQVVVATGPFQDPRVPPLAGDLAPEVFQIHSADYRRPTQVPDGTVLVVGGGNTGFQIAKELADTHRVHLSVGSRQTPLPQRVFGRDLFWWLVRSRLLAISADSRVGQRLQDRDTLIGSSPREIRRHGVTVKPRTSSASGCTITFADGSRLDVDAVIWATGFGIDHSWIHVPSRHRRGVAETEGLYFLGMPWQHTRGSALLGWVKDDAEYIAERISAFGGGQVIAHDLTARAS